MIESNGSIRRTESRHTDKDTCDPCFLPWDVMCYLRTLQIRKLSPELRQCQHLALEPQKLGDK